MKARTVVRVLAVACLIGLSASDAVAAGRPSNQRSTPRSAPVILRTSNSFDWGDAAVGAAAGVGVVIATAGGITLARNK